MRRPLSRSIQAAGRHDRKHREPLTSGPTWAPLRSELSILDETAEVALTLLAPIGYQTHYGVNVPPSATSFGSSRIDLSFFGLNRKL